jgi:hypothetical protein
MIVPSRNYAVKGGFSFPAREIDLKVGQARVLKHPFGVGDALGRPWNREGWDRLEPPVITPSERQTLLAQIASLHVGGHRCAHPEVRGKPAESTSRFACYECPHLLAARCESLVGPGVGERYAEVTEQLLAAVSGDAAVPVPRARYSEVLHRYWREPEQLNGLVVLAVGKEKGQPRLPVAVIIRADGVRADFNIRRSGRLSWRTTYRTIPANAATQINLLWDFPQWEPALGKRSERCMVARTWWERHGS